MFFTRLKRPMKVLTLVGESDGMGGYLGSYTTTEFEGCIVSTASFRSEEAERSTPQSQFTLFYEKSRAPIAFGTIIQKGENYYRVVANPVKSPTGQLSKLWQVQLENWRLPH